MQHTLMAVVSLFGAIAAFALQHLLELDEQHDLYPIRWWCFYSASFMLLRFITGSASHIHIEYRPGAPAPRFLVLVNDVMALVLFAFVAVCLSYANDIEQLLNSGMLLSLAAMFWAILDRWLHIHASGRPANGLARGWIALNLLTIVGLFCLKQVATAAPEHTSIVMPVIASFLLVMAICDLWIQLRVAILAP